MSNSLEDLDAENKNSELKVDEADVNKKTSSESIAEEKSQNSDKTSQETQSSVNLTHFIYFKIPY